MWSCKCYIFLILALACGGLVYSKKERGGRGGKGKHRNVLSEGSYRHSGFGETFEDLEFGLAIKLWKQ